MIPSVGYIKKRKADIEILVTTLPNIVLVNIRTPERKGQELCETFNYHSI